jgi:hypothetical protein
MKELLIAYGIGFVVGWLVCWTSDVIKLPAIYRRWLEDKSRDKE